MPWRRKTKAQNKSLQSGARRLQSPIYSQAPAWVPLANLRASHIRNHWVTPHIMCHERSPLFRGGFRLRFLHKSAAGRRQFNAYPFVNQPFSANDRNRTVESPAPPRNENNQPHVRVFGLGCEFARISAIIIHAYCVWDGRESLSLGTYAPYNVV